MPAVFVSEFQGSAAFDPDRRSGNADIFGAGIHENVCPRDSSYIQYGRGY